MAAATANAATSIAPPEQTVSTRKLLTFFGMVFGMFMAILDIQIVSASLAEIQAGLGASADEISWVQTAYLIAEVIMIPLSGFLSRMLSTRWIFAISAGGFTLMSFLCGTASSINEMIVYRALQGFIGGGMIPTVFASAFTIFPPRMRPIVSPMIGLVATLAPTIGPTVGGYLTDALSWHWLFFINVIPGIIVTVMAVVMIDFDKPNLSLFDHFDWVGLGSMALFLGCLEYVLEEGPNNDWFQDEAVFVTGVLCVIGAVVFFWRVLTAKEPIVDLRAFLDRNFATGSIFSFVMGIGLYGLTYLFPVYLGRVRGYDSLMIGETMFVTGLCMFFTAPIAGRLMTILDPRVMLFAGFMGFAAGTLIMTSITHDWDFYELLIPQVLRGVSLMTCMVSINNIALGTLAPSMMKNASGLFNLTRNLGGAVGLALINTVLNDRTDLHLQRLRDGVSWGRDNAVAVFNQLQQSFATFGDKAEAMTASRLVGMLRREALVLSFSDVFLVLTLLFAGLACVVVFVRKPAAAGGGGGH
ncbi:DHA2 family efflux MFS transporter permease subunit [Terrarubrum flagellatum]|uniref:DHA2 family efflux MFS transporter permease subunit n=1 Tax=Terrirubrum flagellatum TaxID=2895980 RepID=UPI0031454418